MKTLVAIISLALLIYLPSLPVFFSGDDFFHLRISQFETLGDLVSSFSFERNEHSASFYRPLTTQMFFYLGYTLFGLNPIGYHLFSVIVFVLLLYLVFTFAKILTGSNKLSLLTLFFYAFSSSHFAQVYYLSAFQELGMAVFFFAGLIFWLRFLESGSIKELILIMAFFILALLSKETAITFPAIAFLLSVYKKRVLVFSVVPLLLISFIYLFLRLSLFGAVTGESYVWEISPRVFNTLGWYLAWSLGFPEMFLDFIGPKLNFSNKLWLYYNLETKIVLTSLATFIATVFFLLFGKFRKDIISYVFGAVWFFITLLPVLFLPWHKFPLELTMPLFGVSFALGFIFTKINRPLFSLGVISFLILNATSYVLTYKTHWVIRRGEVAQKVINYFQQEYPHNLEKEVYFYNDSAFITDGWGASKHVWTALSGSDALSVYYQKQDFKVSYQDIHGRAGTDNLIRLGTKQFLGY